MLFNCSFFPILKMLNALIEVLTSKRIIVGMVTMHSPPKDTLNDIRCHKKFVNNDGHTFLPKAQSACHCLPIMPIHAPEGQSYLIQWAELFRLNDILRKCMADVTILCQYSVVQNVYLKNFEYHETWHSQKKDKERRSSVWQGLNITASC